MLLVFRQHRLALSATGGASATLPALVQAPARLRANVPSCLLRRATYVLRRGVAGVERERLVCFSFAGVFFFKQKENAEAREVYIF